MEVRIQRKANGAYDVLSVPAPVFDVESEQPLRDDRGVVVYSREEVLKSDFEDEESAIEWAEENGHGVID